MSYAHSLPDAPLESWQPLIDHLKNVAAFCSCFAEGFGFSDWAHLVGLLHDAGKYRPQFQNYLLDQNGLPTDPAFPHCKTEHADLGAILAWNQLSRHIGSVLAYIIAGHHTGLPNFTPSAFSGVGNSACLSDKMKRDIAADFSFLPEVLRDFTEPTLPAQYCVESSSCPFQITLLTRMLFSCLVDADRLDTEGFCSPELTHERDSIERPDLPRLLERLNSFVARFTQSTGPVNAFRAEILQSCLEKAECNQGLFTLAVPTGGGKTLSSLAFALKHALKHGMKRVIYVIPYTSIIEQTADVFRKALGGGAVLEHHCNFEAKDQGDIYAAEQRQRFLSENWDAPLIVTTNVQFYESLFSAHTGKCRKLHNVAESVVILDEAQSLPVDYLKPCLETLKELIRNYKCSVVLCSATQPALTHTDYFPIGFKRDMVTRIIDDEQRLFRGMQRVSIQQLKEPLSVEFLAQRLADPTQVICVVNTRRHAKAVYEALKHRLVEAESIFHLSALMCPVHRSDVLKVIRQRLQDGLPCRVVSTQLIEAGVDIDFPVLYRSFAGVDSIAQAAGRCNREGRLERGQVYVFSPEEKEFAPFKGILQAVETAKANFRKYGDDLLSPESIEYYFQLYYQKQDKNGWDHEHIMQEMNISSSTCALMAQFRDVEKKFKLIKDEQTAVVVPYGLEGEALCQALRNGVVLNYKILRKAQRYSVGLRNQDLSAMLNQNAVVSLFEGAIHVLCNQNAYRQDVGMDVSQGGIRDAGELCI
ncbi:MAG: CRISPR-associated helicase Cas3' [Opitutales bacterium]|nr:CRISPR-associated helicase Cas3' [Opitutales bacterium]